MRKQFWDNLIIWLMNWRELAGHFVWYCKLITLWDHFGAGSQWEFIPMTSGDDEWRIGCWGGFTCIMQKKIKNASKIPDRQIGLMSSSNYTHSIFNLFLCGSYKKKKNIHGDKLKSYWELKHSLSDGDHFFDL